MATTLQRILFIFLISLVLFQNKSNAEHVLGSELTYKFVSEYTVELTLTIYRDCSECKFNGLGGGNVSENCSQIPPILIQGLDAMGAGLKTITHINPTYRKVVNITGSCDEVTNACDNVANPSLLSGVEKHILTGQLDLRQALDMGLCRIIMSSRIFSRPASVVPSGMAPPAFYNFTVLDFCDSIRSGSARFEVDPLFYATSNTPIYHTPGIIGEDSDSISVRLVSARDALGNIPYKAGLDSLRPLHVHCGGAACISDPTAKPPRGLFVDHKTGNTVLTPTHHNESGTMVYEVVKWKKNREGTLKPISIVRRDFVISTFLAQNNGPVFENYETQFNLCIGLDDSIAIPVLNESHQTLFFKTGITPPGITLLTQNQQPAANPKAYFKINSALLKPDTTYRVTLWVEDNHCPLKAIASRTFIFHTFLKPDVQIEIEENECGKLALNALPKGLHYNNYLWNVLLPNGSTQALYGPNPNYQYTEGGGIKIWLQVTSQCRVATWDSIEMEAYAMPQIAMNDTLIGCPGDTLMLEPLVEGGIKPYTFLWNSEPGGMWNAYVVEKHMKQWDIQVSDQLGCEVFHSVVTGAYEVKNPRAKDFYVCADVDEPWYLNNSDYWVMPNQPYGFFSLNPHVLVWNLEDSWFVEPDEMAEIDTLSLVLFHEDTFGCVGLDSFKLIKQNPDIPFEIKEPKPICRASDPIDWYAYFGLDINQGTFSSFPLGLVSDSGLFYPSKIGDGIEEIQFKYQTNNIYCSEPQVFTIKIQEPKEFDFSFSPYVHHVCLSTFGTALGGEEDGVLWSGPGVKDYYFYPNLPEVPTGVPFSIYFNYEDRETGCKLSDSSVYFVPQFPDYAIELEGSQGIGLDGKQHVCIDAAPFDLKLINKNPPESFPFTHHVTFKTDKGVVGGTSLMPDPNGGLHKIILETKQEKCPDWPGIDTLELLVDKVPDVKLSSSHEWQCLGSDSIQLNLDVNDASKVWLYIHDSFSIYDTYSWTHTQASWSENVHWFAPSPGLYTFYLKAVQGSCSVELNDLLPLEVAALPKPMIMTNPDKVIPADFKLIRIKDIAVYENTIRKRKWVIEDRQIEGAESLTYRTFLESGRLSIVLNVEDSLGCTGVDSKFLEVGTPLDIFIPTAFSPDSQGPEKNNVFQVSAGEVFDFEMQIMNRWGEVVFLSNTPDRGWDGTYLNEPCKPGVYAYFIVFVNQFGARKEFKGTLTLVR